MSGQKNLTKRQVTRIGVNPILSTDRECKTLQRYNIAFPDEWVYTKQLLLKVMLQVPRAAKTETWNDIIANINMQDGVIEMLTFLLCRKDVAELYKKAVEAHNEDVTRKRAREMETQAGSPPAKKAKNLSPPPK